MSQRFQVPLTGKYNTRIDANNKLSAASGIVGVGIVGVMVVGGTQSNNSDERWINCFLTTEGSREYAVKRPGFAELNTPATAEAATAIIVWAGQGSGDKVITAFGGTNSRTFDGTTSIGVMTGVCTGITETFVGASVPTVCFTSDDSTAWYYDTATAVTTKITDAQFPGNASLTLAGTFAHLDGFACVLTTNGQLWASDSNSVTAWTANSYGSTDSIPDKGVGCMRYKNYIVAFNALSTEFWANAGLTPFPLARSKTMTIRVGCVNEYAMANISDTLFWAGSTDKGGLSVYKYDGVLERISTPEQDFQMVLAGPNNIKLTTARFYGKSFVIVNANTSTFVYCLEDKRWHEWSGNTRLWRNCVGLSLGSAVLTYAISDSATGKVYTINPASMVFTDDSAAWTATIQSMADDQGSDDIKFWEELAVVADRAASTSTLTVTASDDDFQTSWMIGSVDLSNANPRLHRLGASAKRAWMFTHSANLPFRIQGFRGRMTMGNAPSR